MKNKKMLILTGSIIIFIDQLTKVICIGKNYTIIPNLLNITYTKNTGVAFGVGVNNMLLIIIVSFIMLGVIINFIRKTKVDFKVIMPLVLVLSGGIGNLFDRIFRGYVVDFIDINLFNFPNFNFADISITIGIILLMIVIIKYMINDGKKEDKFL